MYLSKINTFRRCPKLLFEKNYRCLCTGKEIPTNPPANVPVEHPLNRTVRMLKNDMKKIRNFILPPTEKKIIKPAEELDIRDFANRQSETTEFQTNCDVLIIGGGGVGTSIAYWLKKRAFGGLNVVVLEKDPTVNIYMSLFLCVSLLKVKFTHTVHRIINNTFSGWPETTVLPRRKY